MDGFEAVVGNLNKTGLKMEIWVNGSFVTEKLNPSDVDFAARVEGADFDNATPDQKNILWWLNTADLKPQHRCDSYAFVEYHNGHPLGEQGEWEKAYWLRQFGFSRAENPKGLAVLQLPYVIT
ncbi:MAG: hypothetical protein HQ513_14615 [Rhodospirillales bacterium]|nr:hypothetical protein [Rhodospirillales bacterium]